MIKINEKHIGFGEDIIGIILDRCPCDNYQVCEKIRAGLLDPKNLDIHFKLEKSYYDGMCPILTVETAIKNHQIRNLIIYAANSVESRLGNDQKNKFLAFSLSIVATAYLANEEKIPEFKCSINSSECEKYEKEAFRVFREAEELMEASSFQWYRRFYISLIRRGVEDFARYQILNFARIFLKEAFPGILEAYQKDLDRIDFLATLFGNPDSQDSIETEELTNKEMESIDSFLRSQKRGPP